MSSNSPCPSARTDTDGFTQPPRGRRGSESFAPILSPSAPPADTARARSGQPGHTGAAEAEEREDWMFMECIAIQDLLLGLKNLGPLGFFFPELFPFCKPFILIVQRLSELGVTMIIPVSKM